MHSCYVLEADPFARFPIHDGETSHFQLVLWKTAQVLKTCSDFRQGDRLERLFALLWEMAQHRYKLPLTKTTEMPTDALVFY